ncbi:MAG TPA: phosphatase PAP2 family protein [Terriglobales bacterium]|nr:phosphatase PAP2 family protein [Terriglobales bacterium]
MPTQVAWFDLAHSYWLVFGSEAMFVATILFVIGFPPSETVIPLGKKIQREKLRLILILAYAFTLGWLFSWSASLVFTVDAVAVLEFYERCGARALRHAAARIGLPALYLFLGFVLIAAYNLIVVSIRFFAAYDLFFYRADLWLLRGNSVSEIVHWGTRVFPASFFQFLEFIYVSLFPLIGACLILTSVYFGWRRGVQFVGSILMAYYITFVVFFLWPSHGPYYLCQDHFTHFPHDLLTYGAQKSTIATAQGLWQHIPPPRIRFQYFVAFPCMHIAQPLIILWYLRRWRRICMTLAAYNLLLVVAIVGLEWHYVSDILGGILLAALVIFMTAADEMWTGKNALARDNISASEVPA